MTPTFGISEAMARLPRGRPVIVVDADEVVLQFAAGFERFLRARALYLDLSSYRLHGNVRRQGDGVALLDVEVTALLEEFRGELSDLEPVAGACETLAALTDRAAIVVLSNVSPAQAVHRRTNFVALGLDVPVVANAGPKGPAVKALCAHAPLGFFIDDIPQHLSSAAEAAPHIVRIHLIGDDRLRSLLAPAEHAHLCARDWQDAGRFMKAKLDEAGF